MKMKAFKHYGTVAALAVIILIFSILRPASFCTVKNFLNISRQAAPLAMVALGATFVMTINEFDLSVGNIVSLGGVIAALLSIRQVPVVLCFLTAALICLYKWYCCCPFPDFIFYHYSRYGNCSGWRDLRADRRHYGI